MAKKDSPTQKYEVVRKLRHDGDDYAAGDTVELTKEQADQLLSIGAVKTFPVAPQSSTPPKEGDTE